VCIDETRTRQVLINLISEVADATERSGTIIVAANRLNRRTGSRSGRHYRPILSG
jgi:C4-dicarboxylate-specific signal transduction histidine kinase